MAPLPGSHLVAHGRALWKLTAPWTHRTRPPRLGKRCAFSRASTGPFPSNHPRKTPKGLKISSGNPDRPVFCPRLRALGRVMSWQGETRKNTGSIRPRNNAARTDAAPADCSWTFTTGCYTSRRDTRDRMALRERRPCHRPGEGEPACSPAPRASVAWSPKPRSAVRARSRPTRCSSTRTAPLPASAPT